MSNIPNLTILAPLNLDFGQFWHIFKHRKLEKCKIIASKIVKMTFFDPPKSAKVDSTHKIRVARKWLNFHTQNSQ